MIGEYGGDGTGDNFVGVSFKRQPSQQNSSETRELPRRDFISWECPAKELREGKFMWCARRNILLGWDAREDIATEAKVRVVDH